MTSSSNRQIAVEVQGIDLPVYRSPGNAVDGIAFGQMGTEVLVTISSNGEAFFVRLAGDNIDIAAHLMSRCMTAVTRVEHPSLGGVQ